MQRMVVAAGEERPDDKIDRPIGAPAEHRLGLVAGAEEGEGDRGAVRQHERPGRERRGLKIMQMRPAIGEDRPAGVGPDWSARFCPPTLRPKPRSR